jgi:hypothetical protein
MTPASLRRHNFTIPANRLRWYKLLLLVVLIAVAGSLPMSIPTVRRQVKLSATEMPATNTKLYFDNVANLPVKLALGAPVTIKYRIQNQELATTKYLVNVTLISNGHQTVLERKSFTLPSDAIVDLPVSWAPTPSTSYELIVSLPLQSEQIYFRRAS